MTRLDADLASGSGATRRSQMPFADLVSLVKLPLLGLIVLEAAIVTSAACSCQVGGVRLSVNG